MSIEIALIAAVAENGVIGDGDRIPWRLPSDFAHFKRMTLGKPVIMGRRTFESIGKPLPGRTNIVVSRQAGYQPDGVLVISSLEAALEHGRHIAAADGAEEVMVAGGGEIYRAAMPVAGLMYITHVHLAPAGDVRFPEIDPSQWAVAQNLETSPSEKDSATYDIKLYRRRGGTAR